MIKLYKYLYFCIPRLRFLKYAEARNYLDFGCGDGIVLRQNLAVNANLNCFAIDVEDFRDVLQPNVKFSVYDGQDIPFNNNKFDIITANHVLEHIHNPNIILSELKRVIKPGGQIFIEVPNKRSLWGKPGGSFAGTVHFKDDQTHLRCYSTMELAQLCKEAGFTVVKAAISRNLFHLILSPVLLIAGLLMPGKLYFMYGRNSIIGWSSYIIIKKKL